VLNLSPQCLLQQRQMIRSLGKHQHLSPFPLRGQHIPGDTSVAVRIVGEDAEHIMNR